MDKHHRNMDRRGFLAGVSALALLPQSAAAQSSVPTFADFAARCRELTGFDVLPRALVGELTSRLPSRDLAAVAGDDAGRDAEVQKVVLKALYTGVYGVGTDNPDRIAYPDALMYAAIEDAVNVPSFCGGVPGYWAERPEVT